MGRVYTTKAVAIENSAEYSEQQQRDIYVCRCTYQGGEEFVFKTHEDIIDFDSPNIVYVHWYESKLSKQNA